MVFYTVRSASSLSTMPLGIGGDANTIWHCDYNTDLIYELSTTDFSTVRSASSPSIYPYGIGGDANTIWHCDSNTALIYELSTTDFSTVRSASSPSTTPLGIGGDANTIWHCDSNTDLVYELSTTDFSTVRSASSPSIYPYGIGGDANTIWHCDSAADFVYELDSYPNEISYYFNSRSTANWTDPDRMIDNILTNYASTSSDGTIETLNGNTGPGTNLGTIGHIYLSVYAYGDDNDRIDLTPVFSGLTDGSEYQTTPGISAGWGQRKDIVDDSQAPSPWTWTAVQDLDCKVEKDNVSKGNTMYCAKVLLLVTYTPSGGGVALSHGYIFG